MAGWQPVRGLDTLGLMDDISAIEYHERADRVRTALGRKCDQGAGQAKQAGEDVGRRPWRVASRW